MKSKRLLVAAAAALCARAALAFSLAGEVVGIVDGDTLDVLTADKTQYRIRFAAIDAPEKTQPFYEVSRQSLANMVHRQKVTAECRKHDRFRRAVCKVLLEGRDIGLMQIQRGLAWHSKPFAHEQAPADRRFYADAENEARAARRGLWRNPEPVPPWEYRASKHHSAACALVFVAFADPVPGHCP